MEFFRDKRKSVNLILVCTGILIVMIVLFLYSIGIFTDTLSTKLAAVSAVFGVILAIIIIKKLVSLNDGSALISLSDQGITSKVTGVSKAAGLIAWQDISDITLDKVSGDTLVTLTIIRPDKYIPIIKKKLSAMVVNGIEDANGNLPINLTASELTVDAQELFLAITTFKKEVLNTEHLNASTSEDLQL